MAASMSLAAINNFPAPPLLRSEVPCGAITHHSKNENSSSSLTSEHGASAVEYALLVTLIALVIIGAVALFGQSVLGLYEAVCPAFAC